MDENEFKSFLDDKVMLYNQKKFIESDPISIPHRYSIKEDIEIAGFLTATIAWGKRQMIIQNAHKMMSMLDDAPYDFILNHNQSDINRLETFTHRTFNGQDLITFVKNLKHIYTHHNGLEEIFQKYQSDDNLQGAISVFKRIFFEISPSSRSQKHVSDPERNSAAKRINMFLRWMVRKDQSGVDFGIWKNIPMSKLSCPLDLHSGRIARELGLLKRKQNDAKAVKELDTQLRKLDINDPAKYDFALFGLGVFEKNPW